MTVTAACDPRDALARLLAGHCGQLLDRETVLTRLVNPPTLGDRPVVVVLFGWHDGTTAAIAVFDLHLALIIAGGLLGTAPSPAAKVVMAGHLDRDAYDALAETGNVIAALLNSSQPRPLKFTGLSLATADLDLTEAGAYRIDFSMAVSGLGNGRCALLGPAIGATATAAAEREERLHDGGPPGLATLFSDLLTQLFGQTVSLRAGAALAIADGMRGAVAVYARRDGRPGAVAVCELGLAALFGAAPLMIPMQVAQEQARAGRLSGNLLDGCQEVFNVLAVAFASEHYFLAAVHWLPGDLPQAVRRMLTSGTLLPAWEVTVPDYGSGLLAWMPAA